MAGLWTMRDGIPCYTILTTAANTSMQPVHDRMPLALSGNSIESWLRDANASGKILKMPSPEPKRTATDEQMKFW